ncbi:capsid protein [Finch associated genomovirus 6]|uniref:Capsid protein n=1 Tax=Finch associated genomovirus 6 TaxID=2576458 RepID=A0A4P8PT55_9VIRU|nr:capsid protein [Finch associated genomovirus 6]QCQ85163.1 capsid protein [Finch associated genomovirus 6]QCQ85225.1 capsid protein [Finch associated genomovirus 6]
MPRYLSRAKRSRSTRYKKRAPIRKYRRPTRPSRKRYGGKMSKKTVLNLTSTKKRDTMMCYSNSTASYQTGNTTYTNGAAVITGGLADTTAATFLWCATARDNTEATGKTGTKYSLAARTSQSCYMVGLSEKIEVQCNTGMPWQWRRICFTSKGGSLVAQSTSFSVVTETSNGFARVMNQIAGNPALNPQYQLYTILMKGQVGTDWIDPITAPTDNSRVTIKYDKTITLASGNEDGFIRTYKRWHPMGKTLVYDDDELGGGTNPGQFSVDGKAGMGDYYVVDIFRARQGSTSSDQLSVRPQATLYWHEK